ncbi:LCP family protein [Kitasatospora sp. DSM 101779]|uniref:LCP family protein n=1 Tax=Kitasatospora sp. DSM 101779 TaxID=2853165 RepID=UPI0021D9E7E6|nr:LCP family protein [Kitasatospora sp. DSM 101779]
MNSGQRRPGLVPDTYSRAADPSGPRRDGSPHLPAPGRLRRASAATPAAGGRAELRRGRRSAERGRRLARWTGITAALALIAGCGGAYFAFRHFNANIASVDVHVGTESERPQAIEGAVNILVIGTDSRVGLGRTYGDAGSVGHADTTLLLHVARDRSNATVLSIPRDLMVQIPECRTGDRRIPGERRAMFNTSLGEDGRDPGCTWTTVEKLTGIRIDHFMMVNFEAVKTLSTAVGGVEVCAAKNIDDPDSHLRMTKGRHVVEGEEALAFVRTRHAVGLGGDLTRIPLQQQFLGSMIRKIKSGDTLSSPTKVWHLADAATKALTVDSGIDDVRRLKDLALELGKVDTRHITFATVPVQDDPRNKDRLALRQPDAAQLFALVAADRPLDSAAPAASSPGVSAASAAGVGARSSATPASRASGHPGLGPLLDPSEVEVTVRNGSGVGRQAGRATAELQAKGFSKATVGGNTQAAAASSIGYPAGRAEEAAALAAALGLPADSVRQSARLSAGDGLVVVLGRDYAAPTAAAGTGAAGTGPSSPASAAPLPTAVPKNLQRVQADDTDVCAK